jgi:hypothetical protein
MIAALASPLARWGAVAGVCAALGGWGALERAGRQAADLREAAAIARAEAAEARIRTMEARRHVEDRIAREPDPVDRLRGEWTRPD